MLIAILCSITSGIVYGSEGTKEETETETEEVEVEEVKEEPEEDEPEEEKEKENDEQKEKDETNPDERCENPDDEDYCIEGPECDGDETLIDGKCVEETTCDSNEELKDGKCVKKDPDPTTGDCDESYLQCIPSHPPDLDCGDKGVPKNIIVIGSDPHDLDGNDNDGIGCESGNSGKKSGGNGNGDDNDNDNNNGGNNNKPDKPKEPDSFSATLLDGTIITVYKNGTVTFDKNGTVTKLIPFGHEIQRFITYPNGSSFMLQPIQIPSIIPNVAVPNTNPVTPKDILPQSN
jgi:hypothetical protein